MRPSVSTLVVLFVILMPLSISSAASADTISTVLVPFTGVDVEVELTLSDDVGDDIIRGSLEVVKGAGDLRGLFLDIADTSLLSGLSVIGAEVTGFSTGSVIDLGQGANLNGGGTPCPCDIGMEFGAPGTGKDDIHFTEFSLSHDVEALTLALFFEQFVGVRVTSVGDDYDSSREDSAKLTGIVPVPEPVPEPGTASLLMLGLVGLGFTRSRR
jgi:hypothetical protein